MKRRIWIGALVAATLLSGAALAGCGDDDDNGDDGGDTTPVSTQPAAATEPAGEPTEAEGDATEPAGGGVENLTVAAADFSFTADAESVAPGSVVEVSFTNGGAAPHTLTFYTDEEHTEAIPGADSGQVSAGASLNFTFEAPEEGTVYYRCEVHPAQMEGELTVE